MNPTQTNTQEGKRFFIASVDLTGKEGYLAKVINASGKANAALITALTDVPLYIVDDGGAAATNVSLDPLDPNREYRTPLKGACDSGDVLVLADPAVAADAGKVRKLPAAAGVYVQVGKAEQTGVDGQLVLWRPLIQLVRVVSADSLTALTFTAGGATGPEVAALRNAIKAILEEQKLMV